jgi:hypothetical protein
MSRMQAAANKPASIRVCGNISVGPSLPLSPASLREHRVLHLESIGQAREP